MYVPINSSGKLIQNHNMLKSTCILFNTKRGKEFVLTFEHFFCEKIRPMLSYFQIWCLIKRALSVRLGFVYVGPARHVESSFTFRINWSSFKV